MFQPKRILIVDDEQEMVDILQIRLQQAQYDVIVAHDGQEAFEKACGERPDLVLMDAFMPKVDGYLALEKMRTFSKTASIPVIMISAFARREDFRIAHEIGVTDYLTKPLDMKVLMEKIKDLLNDPTHSSVHKEHQSQS